MAALERRPGVVGELEPLEVVEHPSGSTSPNLASMSNRFHSTTPGTRSPHASRTRIGRKPSAMASSVVWRTHPAMVTPVRITVSMAAALRKLDRKVPWKALARFLTITCSPGRGAMRSSISASQVPALSSSAGILRCHSPMSVLWPSVLS